jgi:hypothetical protein
MIVLTSQLADQVRMLTKTASSVGQPYRCAMIDRFSITLARSQPHNSLHRAALPTTQASNLPQTTPDNQHPPTLATPRD